MTHVQPEKPLGLRPMHDPDSTHVTPAQRSTLFRLLIVSESEERQEAIAGSLLDDGGPAQAERVATVGEANKLSEQEEYDAVLVDFDVKQHVLLSWAEVDQMRATISQVNHEIKNPLSIISGNAQLLGELARALGLEDDLMQPIRDIEDASQRIASLLNRLQDVAAMLPGERRG